MGVLNIRIKISDQNTSSIGELVNGVTGLCMRMPGITMTLNLFNDSTDKNSGGLLKNFQEDRVYLEYINDLDNPKKQSQAIRSLRGYFKIFQYEVADAIGIQQTKMSLYERGVQPISTDDLIKMKSFFANRGAFFTNN